MSWYDDWENFVHDVLSGDCDFAIERLGSQREQAIAAQEAARAQEAKREKQQAERERAGSQSVPPPPSLAGLTPGPDGCCAFVILNQHILNWHKLPSTSDFKLGGGNNDNKDTIQGMLRYIVVNGLFFAAVIYNA